MLSSCRHLFTRPTLYRSPPRTFQQLSTTSRTAELGLPDSETLKLPDNRLLGYTQYGDLAGKALFYFHGFPSSRFECAEFDPFAKQNNIRVIGVDRPGMGLSTFQADRKILDWPNDVLMLADHLNLDSFRVMGSSGGSPYALACSYALPRDRLTGVGILAGSGPPEAGTAGLSLFSRTIWRIWTWAPSTFKLSFSSLAKAAQDPNLEKMDKTWEKSMKWMREKDRAVFEDETVRKLTVETLRQALIQGTNGAALEGMLLTQPWGFRIEDIKFEGVKLWYGDEDANTPLQISRYLADRLPGGKLKVFPGVSHFTTWSHGRADEILKEMMDLD